MSNFSDCTVSECSAKLLDNAKIISPIAAPLLFVAIPGVLKLAAMLSRQVSQFEVLSSSFAFVKTPPLSPFVDLHSKFQIYVKYGRCNVRRLKAKLCKLNGVDSRDIVYN